MKKQVFLYERSRMYDDPTDFFRLKGNAGMRLTRQAAIAACRMATSMDIVIFRVEGGRWHNPGFQPDAFAVWNGALPPCTDERMLSNNEKAAQFLDNLDAEYNVAILAGALK